VDYITKGAIWQIQTMVVQSRDHRKQEMTMNYRIYDPTHDHDTVLRIWRETGWVHPGTESSMDLSLAAGRTLVADVHGEAECLVNNVPGTIRYLDQDLFFVAVAAVTTSRLARKQGLARRLTAQAVALDAAEGALVAGLGMFEQGFYNQLGFGTGPYEHIVAFDPTQLNVRVEPRVPRRLTSADWALVHASRLARARGHGSINVPAPEITHGEMLRADNGFGLGYCDGPAGELTHHFWCMPQAVEHGPYFVAWMTYRTREQFLELIALLRSLGDQVRLVRMHEPPEVQMQDLLLHPLRDRAVTRGSEFEAGIRAVAYWQVRICDLPGCLAQTHLPAGEVRFNLHLTDPIAASLEEGGPWRGVAGDYVVTLGPASGAEKGTDARLPTLKASVGAFSRMWLGVRPASGLAYTDDLAGPAELLAQLDAVLRLPEPRLGWEI
jgi:hypothetical protein